MGYNDRIKTLILRMIFKVNNCKIRLELNSNVFAPTIAAQRFLEVLEMKNDEKKQRVLDVGTGTGVFAIYLGLNGYSKILATDCYDKAVECAKNNVELNDLNKQIEVRESNVFSEIKGSEKFGLIVANPSNLPEGIWKDENVKNLIVDREIMGGERGNEVLVSIAENIDEIMDKGRVVFLQPTYTNIDYVKGILKKKGFQISVLYRSKHKLSTWPWNEWKYDKEKLIDKLKQFEKKENGKDYIVYDEGAPSMVIEIVEAERV